MYGHALHGDQFIYAMQHMDDGWKGNFGTLASHRRQTCYMCTSNLPCSAVTFNSQLGLV
jgi:hypothetical protein